ncbi:MAG: mannose-1-phosphate guanylyltransferase, partial [Acidobacteriota bacterium]
AWRARDLLDEIRQQLPDLNAGLERIAEAWGGPRIAEVIEQIYPTLPTISVDFGIMEGAGQRWTLPIDFPWSDVGSWSLASEELPTDEAGNAVRGRVVAEAASDNVLFSSGPVLAVRGVEGLVVVATPDAVLVIPKEQAQEVKRIVDAVRDRGWEDVL